MRKFLLVLLAPLFFSAVVQAAPQKPKLVLVVVFDQFRADYLTRFESRFGPNGFRYFMDKGAYYPLGEYSMLQCETGPGHATILSGSYPYQSGISLNVWYDPSSEPNKRYCVNDMSEPLVGATKPEYAQGISPKNFRGTTYGDELKNAGFPSRVVSVSLKDRSAVLMGGRRADLAVWFESGGFEWISSKYYLPGGELPEWMKKLNADIAKRKGEKLEWKASPNPSGLSSQDEVPAEAKIGAHFPHKAVYGTKESVSLPLGAELVEEAAVRAMDAYKLGNGKSTDVLAVSFSSHDYLGHHYGPNSIEMEELTVAEDKVLADLLAAVGKRVPGGLKNVVAVLTADHGVQIHPEQAKLWKFDSGRIDQKEVTANLNKALEDKWGKADWIPFANDLNFWLNPAVLKDKKLERGEVEAFAKQHLLTLNGAAYVFTSTDVANRKLPPGQLEKAILNSYFPGRSGDIVVIPKPFYAHKDGWYEVGHITGYNYDRRVPIALVGQGIKPGRYAQAAEVIDIAPTLSFLTGILPPALSTGRVLSEIIK